VGQLGRKDFSDVIHTPYSSATRSQVRENSSNHPGHFLERGTRIRGLSGLRGVCRKTDGDHANDSANDGPDDNFSYDDAKQRSNGVDHYPLFTTNNGARYHHDSLHNDAVWYHNLPLMRP
jgi:hypothetical protein